MLFLIITLAKATFCTPRLVVLLGREYGFFLLSSKQNIITLEKPLVLQSPTLRPDPAHLCTVRLGGMLLCAVFK